MLQESKPVSFPKCPPSAIDNRLRNSCASFDALAFALLASSRCRAAASRASCSALSDTASFRRSSAISPPISSTFSARRCSCGLPAAPQDTSAPCCKHTLSSADDTKAVCKSWANESCRSPRLPTARPDGDSNDVSGKPSPTLPANHCCCNKSVTSKNRPCNDTNSSSLASDSCWWSRISATSVSMRPRNSALSRLAADNCSRSSQFWACSVSNSLMRSAWSAELELAPFEPLHRRRVCLVSFPPSPTSSSSACSLQSSCNFACNSRLSRSNFKELSRNWRFSCSTVSMSKSYSSARTVDALGRWERLPERAAACSEDDDRAGAAKSGLPRSSHDSLIADATLDLRCDRKA
mmetsp:Transcript_32875/g.94373  ORF Transcript_32875/g.94373 Transcript_32875/m.94373 type:complete len:351 (-) Transcript_32875:232-1284(-)